MRHGIIVIIYYLLYFILFYVIYFIGGCGHLEEKMTCNLRFKLYSTQCKVADYSAITAWGGYESNSLQRNK